jgi:hypothetical protein
MENLMDDTTKAYYKLTRVQDNVAMTCNYIEYLKTQIEQQLDMVDPNRSRQSQAYIEEPDEDILDQK